jgi:hypothetical protein
MFVILAVALASALFITSCWGGGGRTLWDTNPQAGLLPAVSFAFTGDVGLATDENDIGGYYSSLLSSIGISDGDSGASVIMLPDTYVTVWIDGIAQAPTWINLGVGPLDTAAANAAYGGFEKIGGAKIIAETSLGSDNVMFSRNLIVTLPVVAGVADGTSVSVYEWNGSNWSGVTGVSQFGGYSVVGSLVTIYIDSPGNYAVFRLIHTGGGGGGG